jgi:hypothetical protein
MYTLWENFAAFWEVWGPFIATSLVPTIITGLSVSAKTAEAKSVFETFWNAFKRAMDFLSLATHKDKEGTFQAPFKLGVLVKKVAEKKDEVPPPTLLLIFVLSAPALYSGCSWLKQTGNEAKNTTIDCSVESVKDNARGLVPAVIGILTGGSVNWKDQIEVFVKEFGRDATACAVQVALQRLNDPIASEPEEDPEAVRRDSAVRAGVLIDEQRWSFKPID